MKKVIFICVVVNLIILSNVSFAANWTPFIIRNANTSGDVPTFSLSGGVLTVDVDSAHGGQKVGYGTCALDGRRLDSITRFQVVRLDSHPNDYAPYINIWVTDGTHFAVLSLEPSHYSQFAWTHDLEAADYLSIKPWIYETDTSDLTWILSEAYYEGRYIKVNGAPVTIADIGHLTIKPPTPSEFATLPGVGSGAPRELGTDIAYGFTLVFGDTQSNYIGGYQIDANPILGPPQEVWVDDDYCDGCLNDGHIWGYDAFATIQDGIDNVGGSTVHVAAGTYDGPIFINKPLIVRGATWMANKNGYMVPANYAWDDSFESIINHPNPGGGYIAIVNIEDVDDVTFEGFVVQELNAEGNKNSSLIRVYAHSQEISNIVVRNNVIGPNTNVTYQDGKQGRMGLYIVNHPYDDNGVINSAFTGNKIFDCKGNGNNVFIWSSYFAYGAPGPASMDGTIIADNEIYGSHRSGIETAGGYSGLTIRNNRIYDNTGLPSDNPNHLKYGNGILLIRGSSDKASGPTEAYGPKNLIIEGNEIYDNEKNGIYMGPINNNYTITRNAIYNNGWDAIQIDLEGTYWNPTFEPAPNDWSSYDGTSNISATRNSIVGNGAGIQVIGIPNNGFVLDATCNWWGDDSGPGPVGYGDNVSDYVDYNPWLSNTWFQICKAKIEVAKKKARVKGKKGKKWEYKRPKGGKGKIKKMKIDWKNATFDTRMEGRSHGGDQSGGYECPDWR